MHRKVLVPSDGSPLSERALRYALPIAERHRASVIVLHVAAPLLDAIAGGGAPVRDAALDAEARQEDRKLVERIAKRARKQTSVPVEVAFRSGRAAAEITEFAAAQSVDLVVMCTHGRGGFERLWIGSVADALLRQLKVPTLLVRGARGAALPEPDEELFPRVLVPLDGSPLAERAVAATLELVAGAPLALTLLSVVNPTAALRATESPSPAERELIQTYLEPLAARSRSANTRVDVETAVTANVARAIVEHAKRREASLIAIATQGLGGVQRFVMGSVADKLLRTATTPLLVLP